MHLSNTGFSIAKSLAGLVLTFNVLALLWVMIYAYFPIAVTKLMVVDRREKEVSYEWVDLHDISDTIQLAVMCAEDQHFLLHHGLDYQSIDRAVASNRSGRRMRGASTITQQVAKNVFLWPSRDWVRKGAEVYFALLIEMVWSKERIMEVYLNVAELGDGIYGVEAASNHYFDKHAADLYRAEAALLAAILPSPKKYSATSPGPYVQKRTRWILNQMSYWGNKMNYERSFAEEMIK